MVISVVLDTEYLGMESRIKRFLKNCSLAENQNYVIITHECLRNKIDELINSCEDRFFDEFEMKKMSSKELGKLDICYIPDTFFIDIYKKCHSRTKMIMKLYQENCVQIYDYLVKYIDKKIIETGEKIDYVTNCIHTFKFVDEIAKHYNVAVIPYVFSAIRKVHGYTQTLYMVNIDKDLFDSQYAKKLYKNYHAKKHIIFSRKEILALLGKNRNLPLISLIDYESENSIGVIGEGFHVTPQSFLNEQITDDDLYYEIKQHYGEYKIPTRLHPLQMNQSGFGRKHMKNDPVEFVLSCKRLCTIQSQMILKAAMWNRVSIAYSNSLPYSFLLENELTSEHKMSESDLNFILFAYFVPDSLMFSKEYWMWRLTNPSTDEIFERNRNEILKNLSINIEYLDSDNRIKKILANRGVCEKEIDKILCKTYNISKSEYLISKFILSNGKDFYVRNNVTDNLIETSIEIKNYDRSNKIYVYLLDGIDGFVSFFQVLINNEEKRIPSNKYYSKGEKTMSLEINPYDEDISIVIKWNCLNYEQIY